MSAIEEIEAVLMQRLPAAYTQFLEAHADGADFRFDPWGGKPQSWKECHLYGQSELTASFTFLGFRDGKILTFRRLEFEVYAREQADGITDIDSPEGTIPASRVASGICIGSCHDDILHYLLYLDPAEGFSVWMFEDDPNDCTVQRVSEDFAGFLSLAVLK